MPVCFHQRTPSPCAPCSRWLLLSPHLHSSGIISGWPGSQRKQRLAGLAWVARLTGDQCLHHRRIHGHVAGNDGGNRRREHDRTATLRAEGLQGILHRVQVSQNVDVDDLEITEFD